MEYKYSKHPSSKIGPKEAKFICENYGKLSCNEIAKHLKISQHPVLNVLHLNNIKIKNPGSFSIGKTPKHALKLPEDKIISLYNKEIPVYRIAKMFNVSSQPILNMLKRRGVFCSTTKAKLRIQKYKQDIIEKYKSGKFSIKQLEIMFNVRRHSISKIIKDNGIKIIKAGYFNHKNAKHLNAYGYVVVKAHYSEHHLVNNPKAQIFEHRLVMARHLNRPLRKDENVHHINGNKQDNRLENLELWSKHQLSGQRVVDKIKYAKEILALYEKDYKKGLIK